MTGLILIMILLNKLARFYHFSRPILSSVTSLKSLEGILQDRLISAIKASNTSTLRHYSFTSLIQQQLVLGDHPAKFISERSISLSLLFSRSPHHQEVELRLDQELKDLRLSAAEFGNGLGSDASSMRHFSKARGVASI